MKRTVRDNRDLPHPRPVEKIELSAKGIVPRAIAAIIFLVIGATALANAFSAFVSGEQGWQEIQANSADFPSCAGDFVLNYNLGAGDVSAAVESRGLRSLYTDAAVRAYQMFDTAQSWEGTANLYDLNHRPNEALTVDPALYSAFELLERYGDRQIYLGPAWAVYESLFACENDAQAAAFDPFVNEAQRSFAAQVAAFARDPEAVDLELLGENCVRLNVSEGYLHWAEENEVDRFLDFGWMRNAFQADYLADSLAAGGYTRGILSSYDGFIRNLDDSGVSYTFQLFSLDNGALFPAAEMRYSHATSLVFLRAYPMSPSDRWRYYQTEDWQFRVPYLDPADGLTKAAAQSLLCYSQSAGCAEIVMQAAPVYATDAFQPDRLQSLAEREIWSIYFEGRTICHNGPELLSLTVDAESLGYSINP